MPVPTTAVSFPSGAVEDESTVVAVVPLSDGRAGVITAASPFHPVDHTWPDQPGDTGTLDGVVVTDTVTAASQDTTTLVGEDIPVRRGDPDWTWQVLHVLDGAAPEPGATVALRVDGQRRAALSAGHTGCHLAAFALNAALAGQWRKEVRADSLGNPDFDGLALQSSHIHPHASTDVYRMGKSLRKKGFAPTSELDADTLAAAVNDGLAAWLATGATVTVAVDGPLLTDMRRWTCPLPGGLASVACGGTHVDQLSDLEKLAVRIELSDDGFTMYTTVG